MRPLEKNCDPFGLCNDGRQESVVSDVGESPGNRYGLIDNGSGSATS